MLQTRKPVLSRRSRVRERHCQGVLSAVSMALGASLIVLIASMLPAMLAGERDEGDSESATQFLQTVRENREVLSEDFRGFRSGLSVHVDGATLRGTCEFRPPRDLQIELGDAEVPETVASTVRSMLTHRLPSNPSRDEVVAFGVPDEHWLGRKLVFADSYRSEYRIRDRRILQVDRRLGDFRRVISVLETETTESGRYLPRTVQVVELNKQTGAIDHAWTYINRYQRVDGEYLPLSRQEIRARDGGVSALMIEWHDAEILGGAQPAQ